MIDKNLYGLFRVLGDEYEDLRKAVTGKISRLFRLIEKTDTTEDLT